MLLSRCSGEAAAASSSNEPPQQARASTIFDDDWLFDISRHPSACPEENQIHKELLPESADPNPASEAGAETAAALGGPDAASSSSQRFWFSNMLPPTLASSDVQSSQSPERAAGSQVDSRPPGDLAPLLHSKASLREASSEDSLGFRPAAGAPSQLALQNSSLHMAPKGSAKAAPLSNGLSRLSLTNPQLKAAQQELTVQHAMPVLDGYSGEQVPDSWHCQTLQYSGLRALLMPC